MGTVTKRVTELEVEKMISDMRGMGLAELLTRMRECAGINRKVNEMNALVGEQHREILELKAALK